MVSSWMAGTCMAMQKMTFAAKRGAQMIGNCIHGLRVRSQVTTRESCHAHAAVSAA